MTHLPSPSTLEAAAVDAYRCPDCGADLDHPGADCPTCGAEPFDPTPQEDGPDAADLWEREHRAAVAEASPVAYLVGFLVCGAVGALFALWLVSDVHEIDALIAGWKAEAWAWLVGVDLDRVAERLALPEGWTCEVYDDWPDVHPAHLEIVAPGNMGAGYVVWRLTGDGVITPKATPPDASRQVLEAVVAQLREAVRASGGAP